MKKPKPKPRSSKPQGPPPEKVLARNQELLDRFNQHPGRPQALYIIGPGTGGPHVGLTIMAADFGCPPGSMMRIMADAALELQRHLAPRAVILSEKEMDCTCALGLLPCPIHGWTPEDKDDAAPVH
jgi:hypothetical protein